MNDRDASTAGSSRSADDSSSGRVLVVDDQPANLRIIGALLERHGYEVVTAGNGDEALARCGQAEPDLILLDMMMPVMDGFAVLDALRAQRLPSQVPVVFVTAAHDRDLLLRAFDAGVVDYVTKPFLPEELLARVSAHMGLKMTRDRLARVAREREELVTLVAHDLKNPLSSVLFASEALRNNGCKPERVPRYLEMIHSSAQDALGYIHHYLETRSGRRRDAARIVVTSLRDTMHWLLQRYEMQLEASGVRVELSLPPEHAHVVIDPRVLRQVAENLVTNAMKYAPGSTLSISGHAGAPGYWRLQVADRGPGIPANLQRQLFKPFNRLLEADDGHSSGLGLSLAKEIITGAGGQLWYEDRDGGGACLLVELPEAPPQAKP